MPSTFHVLDHSARSAAGPADCWARTSSTEDAAKTETTARRYLIDVLPRPRFRSRLSQKFTKLELVLWIDGLLSTLCGFERQPRLLRPFLLLRTQRVVRNVSARMARDFVYDFERPTLIRHHIGGLHPLRSADERLFQVDRIVDERHQRQIVAVADEMFGHDSVRAARNAVALNDAVFHVCRRDRQLIAFQLAGRETVPGMLGVLGRAGA